MEHRCLCKFIVALAWVVDCCQDLTRGDADEKLDYQRRWFMYYYEDRIRAVELYIRLGKRVRATILQLGLPDQECLEGLAP